MKPNRPFILLLLLICPLAILAQSLEYTTIQGQIKDAQNRKRLENVSISLKGTEIGTISNKDGAFTLKIKKGETNQAIRFSHLGYQTQDIVIPVKDNSTIRIGTVMLHPKTISMNEVIVTPIDPAAIVETALSKIKNNYPTGPTYLTGFYRETVQKKKRYISVAEAVLQMKKGSYGRENSNDKVYILQGRKLISPKQSDTLSVKLQGGPLQGIDLDFMKIKWPLLERENLIWYHFDFVDYASIDGRLFYKIAFKSIIKQPFPLISGFYYIDKETLAINRMELFTDMSDLDKVTEVILRKKPVGMRFRPQELTYLVLYKTTNGVTQLDYASSTLKFQCDWKKKLFHTNYTITSETVVTDRNMIPPTAGELGKPFRTSYVLPDRIENFTNPDFWKNYNIIEPTETLNNAVNKLKKAYR